MGLKTKSRGGATFHSLAELPQKGELDGWGCGCIFRLKSDSRGERNS